MSSGGRGFRFNEGDWTCPECSNVNFARRSQCNRCGTERKYETKKIKKGGVEIGKAIAEKSKGLFSADDWMCKTCGNVNWARRNDCNMCNSPKINIQEERTGYGGGFNEREGVQYKEKQDSDGEFDEFGRKKKKFRGKAVTPHSAALDSAQADEDAGNSDDSEDSDDENGEDASKYDLDADDDDDDDDDGDTTKYDLAGSEDGADDKNSDRSTKSGSRSRSRSRSQKSGRRSSSSSRSRSGSRRRRSRSSSVSSGECQGRRGHRQNRKAIKQSRSRSRSPLHRHLRGSSSEHRHHHRH